MTGELEVVIFPRVYKEKPELWGEGDRVLVVSGRVQEKDGEVKFLAETGYEVNGENIDEIARYIKNPGQPAQMQEDLETASMRIKRQQAVTLYLRAQLPESILFKLRAVLDQYPGSYHVYFTIDQAEGRQKILSSYRIAFDELIAKELEGILGPETVKIDT
jgi:DNA polymerase III alpha subunit